MNFVPTWTGDRFETLILAALSGFLLCSSVVLFGDAPLWSLATLAHLPAVVLGLGALCNLVAGEVAWRRGVPPGLHWTRQGSIEVSFVLLAAPMLLEVIPTPPRGTHTYEWFSQLALWVWVAFGILAFMNWVAGSRWIKRGRAQDVDF